MPTGMFAIVGSAPNGPAKLGKNGSPEHPARRLDNPIAKIAIKLRKFTGAAPAAKIKHSTFNCAAVNRRACG
jgi:hypothetical protein